MRGQSGIEFIVLLGFLILVFLGFSFVINAKINEQHEANRQDLYAQLADKIEREVLLAARVRPGYSRQFTLPMTLDGELYEVHLETKDTLVIILSTSANEYLRFLSVNVTLYENPGPGGTNIFPDVNERDVIIQKNEWGELFMNRGCVRQDVAAPDCKIP